MQKNWAGADGVRLGDGGRSRRLGPGRWFDEVSGRAADVVLAKVLGRWHARAGVVELSLRRGMDCSCPAGDR